MRSSSLTTRYAKFDHINVYFDRLHQCHTAKLLPGEYYMTTSDECIVTVLGSCVSACVRDRMFGIGGMNHFMLPVSHDQSPTWGGSAVDVVTRYGDYAMEHLLNDIISHGGLKENFEVKLFGGAMVNGSNSDVGPMNIRFIRQFLKDEGIQIDAEDLGGNHPRKIYYFPRTGKVMMKRITTLHNHTIFHREHDYQHHLDVDTVSGEIELFGQ